MVYLAKNIVRIFIVDFFTQEEREVNGISFSLSGFLLRNNINITCHFPDSREQLFGSLVSIQQENIEGGVIIHFIGHGDNTYRGFGNNNFFVQWNELNIPLVSINQVTNDCLIVNTTIMCSGVGVFQLINGQKPFYAAIGSLLQRSSQALAHNIEIYRKCLKKDYAEYWLNHINDMLKISQDQNQYELRFA